MSQLQYNKEFYSKYMYYGDDLGVTYDGTTSFRIWAPIAVKVSLRFYKEGSGDNFIKEVGMKKDIQGTWFYKEDEDILGYYYTYYICNKMVNRIDGRIESSIVDSEVVDPYAKAVGVNGMRGMIIDLSTTNPEGFYHRRGPKLSSVTDAVIYELHIRDLSMWEDSGIKNKGKYLGITEFDTHNEYGDTTGLSHIIDLGVTHVHLLPIFDYASIDESKLEENNYNWGYDPLNYNAPEGSYSTNPQDGEVRIRELKEAIDSLHQNNVGVIMDVVYNHTYTAEDSNLNQIVPNYYYRMEDGEFTNGSACGNETASEHGMMRKFMVDSLIFWAKEYNIDGFRFDLMGLHDIDTMNEISRRLHEINPNIILYGEGWTGGDTPLLEERRSLKKNVRKLENIAVFSDDMRDGIKGSVFEELEQGFVSGGKNLEETIKFSVVGGINHPEIDYRKVNYSKEAYATHPTQVINYASAHDNLTLWDKLAISNYDNSEEERLRMNLLSIGIVMTSQGIPFFQAGEELLRSKKREDGRFEENSYRSSDNINAIRWNNKSQYKKVFEYYKGLIQFRKEHVVFRMSDGDMVRKNISFIPIKEANVVAFILKEQSNNHNRNAESDKARDNKLNNKNNIHDNIAKDNRSKNLYLVLYNGNKEGYQLDLSNYHSYWDIYVNHEKAASEIIESIEHGQVLVEGLSMLVMKSR